MPRGPAAVATLPAMVLVTVLALLLTGTGCALVARPSAAAQQFSDPTALALAEAVADGDRDLIARLVGQGADPNATGADGLTLLQWAVMVQNVAGLSGLLAAGAEPDRQGRGGRAALHDAAWLEDPELARLLLAAGADPDVRNRQTASTPLREACLNHRNAVLEVLVAAKADVDAVDRLGETPIHTCARVNAGDLVLRLLELGADPVRENSGGSTFQDYYFSFPREALNETAIAERTAVIGWLEAHDVAVNPEAYG